MKKIIPKRPTAFLCILSLILLAGILFALFPGFPQSTAIDWTLYGTLITKERIQLTHIRKEVNAAPGAIPGAALV